MELKQRLCKLRLAALGDDVPVESDTLEQARARKLITAVQKNRKLQGPMNTPEGRKANKLFVEKGTKINPKKFLKIQRMKGALQKMAGIDDIVKKITDLGMKEREKGIPKFLASPRGGSPQLQRFDPTTPLIKKVPFGPSAGRVNPPDISIPKEQKRKLVTTLKRPERLKRMRKNIEKREIESKGLAKDIVSMEGKPEKNPLLTKTNKGFKVRPPKPTKTEFREIISAKLLKMAGLRPLILKKKKPKRIKNIPTKRAVMTGEKIIAGPTRPLTGGDILQRFKNTGVSNVQKESGFIFLADENRVTDAFKPVDAQFLRTKFKTPKTSSLAFISRTLNVKNPDELAGPLENLRTEGKTLLGGFNSKETGFEFDATFPMASQNDNEVISELVKTNQESALAIDPDLSVRTISNPKFNIKSKTNQ